MNPFSLKHSSWSLLLMAPIGLIVLIGFANVNPVYAAPQRQLYLGDPISITLALNSEKRITFPDSAMLWADVKESIRDRLEIQIVKNNLYLKAKAIIKQTRLVIGEEGSAQVYLLDLSTTQKAVGKQRLIIALGKDHYAVSAQQKKQEREQRLKNKPVETVVDALKNKLKSPTAGYKTLFQYAAREIYAPKRLRAKTKGVYHQFVNKRKVLHLLRGNQVMTTPIASWRSGFLQITAVSVLNKSKARLSLDPRLIRGQWKAALFHRSVLTPAGSPNDNTTLYLISTAKFAEVIRSNPIIKVDRR